MMAMNNLLLFWEWQGDGCLFVFSSDISDGKTIGFASQLCLLVKALEMSLEAQFMEDFVSGLKNFDASFYVLNMNYSWYVHILSKIQLLLMLAFQVKISYFYTLFFFPSPAVENSGSDNFKSSAVIPPPTVLDRVLKDLFHQGI